nr:hypothetical protein [Tanacetum cinerariifolium]
MDTGQYGSPITFSKDESLFTPQEVQTWESWIAHLKMIPEMLILHEEFHDMDHHRVQFMTVDKGEPTGTTGLGAAAAWTGETTLGRGLKYSSNIG